MGGTEAGLIGEAGAAAKTREAEAVALERGRAALVAAVRRVRRQIKEPMRGAASKDSLDSLRQDITAAEAALVNYKNDQRRGYELLRQSEVSLNRDLELFAETIESWEHDNDLPLDMPATQRPKKRLGARARATSATPQAAAKEVAAFDAYVAQHGPSGGWDSADHSAFLSVWSRYVKTAEASAHSSAHWAHSTRFIASVCAALPAMGEEEAIIHAEWYLKYIELLDAKRDAIRMWRDRKTAAAERRRIAAEEQAAAEEAGAGPKLLKGNNPEARRENHQRLAEWRERRKVAKAKELEARRAEEDRIRAKRMMTERRDKERREQIRRQREERLAEEKRQSELLSQPHGASTASRRPSHPGGIAALQERDRLLVERRKQARLAKQQSVDAARRVASGERPPSSQSTVSKVSRDPERLYKPTMTTLLRYGAAPLLTTRNAALCWS